MGLNRFNNLIPILESKGLDAFLVSQPDNRFYLSSFTGSDGCLIISPQTSNLFVDFRYIEQAKIQSPSCITSQIKGGLHDWLPEFLSNHNIKTLGFESGFISHASYRKICEALESHGLNTRLIPCLDIVESLRMIKEPRELEYISHAAALADSAMAYINDLLKPGMTEKHIAWELEKFIRENGSDSVPFKIIVGSGPNAAMPHATQSDRILQENEPIVIDLGAQVNGYCSDITRTFFIGEPDAVFAKVYDIILSAQTTAIELIAAGMTGDRADNISRQVIQQSEYRDCFGHGLGHGIGLATHELPRLGSGSSDILSDNMVFSIEPGIYIPGWGGVRIEDTVVMENGAIRLLTRAKK